MITYINTSRIDTIAVKLSGKKVGFIRSVTGGWQYFPASTPKNGGEIFPTLQECKESLLENRNDAAWQRDAENY